MKLAAAVVCFLALAPSVASAQIPGELGADRVPGFTSLALRVTKTGGFDFHIALDAPGNTTVRYTGILGTSSGRKDGTLTGRATLRELVAIRDAYASASGASLGIANHSDMSFHLLARDGAAKTDVSGAVGQYPGYTPLMKLLSTLAERMDRETPAASTKFTHLDVAVHGDALHPGYDLRASVGNDGTLKVTLADPKSNPAPTSLEGKLTPAEMKDLEAALGPSPMNATGSASGLSVVIKTRRGDRTETVRGPLARLPGERALLEVVTRAAARLAHEHDAPPATVGVRGKLSGVIR